jgi:hypothetical protein
MSRRAAIAVVIVAALAAVVGIGAIDRVTPAATIELRAGTPRPPALPPPRLELCARGPGGYASAAAAITDDLAELSALAHAAERAAPLPQRMGVGVAARPATCATIAAPP